MNEVAQLISTVGFPIVMCLILMWYIKDMQDSMRETLNDLKSTISILNEKIEKLEINMNKDKNDEI